MELRWRITLGLGAAVRSLERTEASQTTATHDSAMEDSGMSIIGLREQTVHGAKSIADACARHRWNVPADYNVVVDCLDRHTELRDKVALFYEDDEGRAARYTFGQMIEASAAFRQCAARDRHQSRRRGRDSYAAAARDRDRAHGALSPRRDRAADLEAVRSRRAQVPARQQLGESDPDGARERREDGASIRKTVPELQPRHRRRRRTGRPQLSTIC